MARLNPEKPPGDVSWRRWAQFIDDCHRFLDADWAYRAAALGWTPLDLFGCDRERPMARIDHQGLLWLLNGNKIVALTAETAVIEMASGSRLTYRRTVVSDRTVLAWELFDAVEGDHRGGHDDVHARHGAEDPDEPFGPGRAYRPSTADGLEVAAGGAAPVPPDLKFGPEHGTRRPVTKDGFEVIGPEYWVPCAQCGKSEGAVYVIRYPSGGVRSEVLHEDCAAAWFSQAGGLVTDKAGLRPEAGPCAGAETGPPLRLIESKRGPGRCAQCSDLRDGTETEFIIHGARVLLHKECVPYYTKLNGPHR